MSASKIIADLRAERERQGISRPALAELTGYSLRGIETLETSHNVPSFHKVCDIAGALGFDLVLVKRETP